MARIGKVKEVAPASHMLVGKARYGTAPVHLKVAVRKGDTPEASILEIEAEGTDVWGVNARKVTERLLLAIG